MIGRSRLCSLVLEKHFKVVYNDTKNELLVGHRSNVEMGCLGYAL